ncbi:hypothetical protein [Maribellus maritimus]|uniref:hypothetical protein n=1 Tax=Maribellus maritimus TaxID=2870838 RepID=UPI001EE9D728|nr:hypothetical protein [Maribellus maritimus]MCG6186839.1 hypothetical protein [Maribellus maritimus]
MRHELLLIIFILISLIRTYAQNSYITVICTDVRTGKILNDKQIVKGTVYLNRSDGPTVEYGPILDGKFEIYSNCLPGDKFILKIDQGFYFGKTYYFVQIKNFGNRFPLLSRASLTQLEKNLNSFQSNEFENNEIKYASMAYISNSIATIQKENSNLDEYNLKAKEAYVYVGKVLKVENPVYFDPDQDKWVPSKKLVQRIIDYKELNGFSKIDGQINPSFLRNLTGLDPTSKYLDPDDIYKKVEKNFELK